jgi:hypothetical protein
MKSPGNHLFGSLEVSGEILSPGPTQDRSPICGASGITDEAYDELITVENLLGDLPSSRARVDGGPLSSNLLEIRASSSVRYTITRYLESLMSETRRRTRSLAVP